MPLSLLAKPMGMDHVKTVSGLESTDKHIDRMIRLGESNEAGKIVLERVGRRKETPF